MVPDVPPVNVRTGGGGGGGGGGMPRKRRRGDKARAKRAARKRQRGAAKRRRQRRRSGAGGGRGYAAAEAAAAAAALGEALGEALVGRRIRVAVLGGIGDGDGPDGDGPDGDGPDGDGPDGDGGGAAESFRWVAATVCAYSARSGKHRVRLVGLGEEDGGPDTGDWLLLEESPASLSSLEDEPIQWEDTTVGDSDSGSDSDSDSDSDNTDSTSVAAAAAAAAATTTNAELPQKNDPGWSDFSFVKEQFSAAHGYGGWALEFASEALRADPELLRLAVEASGEVVRRFAFSSSSTSVTSAAAAASASGVLAHGDISDSDSHKKHKK